ncbi:MAG: acetyl-CoA acetyltransferase [Chloroflexota bacterium]|nr:acetyl-CoA acetyltransferase [Chloroflexota bacterium]
MVESIKDRVAIVGMGCTQFGELWDKSRVDLIVEAAKEAYEDAGIEQKDIQAGWYSNYYDTTGLTGMGLAGPLRMDYLPITRVENACASASDTLRNATYAVAAGIYDRVLVLGAEKIKDQGLSGLAVRNLDMGGLMFSMTMPGMFSMMATKYFNHYNISPEDGKRMLAYVSWKSHKNGVDSPKAHFRKEVSMEQIIKAPIIAWPLGLFDCCGVSDGAAAAIIVPAKDAKKYRDDPVYIKALQMSVAPADGTTTTKYDFLHVESTRRAGAKAFEEAGITNPREEIDMAELHDCFSITEAVTMEDLLFSKEGNVKEDIESGFFDRDGGLSVQPDGGLKCFGHPIGATGLRMVYEIYKQCQGKADKRQLKDPKLGLTHNLGGQPPHCTIFVGVFGT